MRRLILTAVSVIALGSAGLTYAGGQVTGNTANSPASLPPATSGASGSNMTGINAGTPNASSAPAGTSQPGYNHNQAATGNSQWDTTGSNAGTPGVTSMSSSPGTSQPWHDEVSQAQQKLHQEGLYHGNIDGVLGPETKQALRQYQQQNGLSVTANLDRQTWDHLFGGPPGGHGSSMPPNQAGAATTNPMK